MVDPPLPSVYKKLNISETITGCRDSSVILTEQNCDKPGEIMGAIRSGNTMVEKPEEHCRGLNSNMEPGNPPSVYIELTY